MILNEVSQAQMPFNPHTTQARRTNLRTSQKGKQNDVAYNHGGVGCTERWDERREIPAET
jgi:hypothetical protein